MSTGSSQVNGVKKRNRKLYSKGGCKECKRRKIKCNEAKPYCGQCERLNKFCQYPPIEDKLSRLRKKVSPATFSDNLSRSTQLDHMDSPNKANLRHQIETQEKVVNNSDNGSSGSAVGSTEESTPILNFKENIGLNRKDSQRNVNTVQYDELEIFNNSNLRPILRRRTMQQVLDPQKRLYIANNEPKLPPLNHEIGNINQMRQNQASPLHRSFHQSPTFCTSQSQYLYLQPPHPRAFNQIKFSPVPSLDSALIILANSKSSVNQEKSSTFISDAFHSSMESTPDSSITQTYVAPLQESNTSSLCDPLGDKEFPTPGTFFMADTDNNSILLSKKDKVNSINQEDLNLLASDLNDIVTDIILEDEQEKNKQPETSDQLNVKPVFTELASLNMLMENISSSNSANLLNKLDSISNSKPSKNLYGNVDDGIQKNVPFDFIKLQKPHEKLYLDEFYNDFSNVILPFTAYDEEIGASINPARDILLTCASRESYLLAAILAQGAKTSFNKNGLPEDEEAYSRYLSVCLKLLENTLNKSQSIDNKKFLTTNIEAVLLTVLLLTSANASNTKQKWRGHLRGAKDLLLKYFFASSSSNAAYSNIRYSRILVFCKYWFISIEILAGLCSNIGGTLVTDRELDLLISPDDEYEIKVMKELKIIKENGFNILFGYNNSCATHLRDLIKILNKVRAKDKLFEASDSIEYIRLLSEFHEQSKILFISKDCIVPMTFFKNRNIPEGELIDHGMVDQTPVFISWMDTSHQAYVTASLITILTKCFQLQYNSSQVHTLTNQLISRMSFLVRTSEYPLIFKYANMMIQWPMFVAGLNCTEEEQRYLILKYFRISGHIGSGSAAIALRKVNKVWSSHSKEGKSESEEDELEASSEFLAY